eukprot:g6227.t1
MSKRSKKRAYAKKMKEREKQFDMRFTLGKLPKYNGLYDKNLRHHFENRRIQSHLASLGLIDSEGRVVDLDKAKGKVAIILQEFKNAERAEEMRMKEEAEMRRRVQKKRHETLERGRRAERLLKIKDDRRIRLEILEAARGVVEVPNVETNAEREFKKFQKRRMKRSMAGGQGGSMYGTMNDASDLI